MYHATTGAGRAFLLHGMLAFPSHLPCLHHLPDLLPNVICPFPHRDAFPIPRCLPAASDLAGTPQACSCHFRLCGDVTTQTNQGTNATRTINLVSSVHRKVLHIRSPSPTTSFSTSRCIVARFTRSPGQVPLQPCVEVRPMAKFSHVHVCLVSSSWKISLLLYCPHLSVKPKHILPDALAE